ncbi:hypothetical protein HY311_02505 [Candidatus Nomurabacteria bacterium]|nr:hypothetical protein [Candidatus Nomurabacteria bacterium]
MDITESFHRKWIKKIAKRSSPVRIKRHIIHHAKQLSDSRHSNPKSWAASMHNLLKIYESVHKIKPVCEIQVYKLVKKYNKNPRTNTPPPGNKIPKGVKIREVKAGSV